MSELSIAVGRALGTVVVTLHGGLDTDNSPQLEGMLVDLIEGQGNRTVAIDLEQAVVEPEALSVLVTAAGKARRRGARLVVKALPRDAYSALKSAGVADAVEVLPAFP